MNYFNLYRISSYLLMLGFLGHTFGGILGTAKNGLKSGPEADEVFSKMKSVNFIWNGGNCTWYNFWLGNGLGVSALIIPMIVLLFTLGGLRPDQMTVMLPLAWTAFLALVLLTLLGFKYFVSRIGIVFGIIAILCGIATFQATFS